MPFALDRRHDAAAETNDFTEQQAGFLLDREVGAVGRQPGTQPHGEPASEVSSVRGRAE